MTVASFEMAARLSLLWTTLADAELALVEEMAEAHGAQLLRIGMARLGARLAPLLVEGAVVVFVERDRDASHALSLGVDEVLRSGEITPGALSAAIERARSRASGRLARDSGRRALQAEDSGGFSLLAAALGNELGGPLMVASSSCEMVSCALVSLVGVTDELAGWAALSAPTDHLRRLLALRSSAPSSRDLNDVVGDARTSLERAVALIRTLRELSFDGGEGAVDVRGMLTELVNLLRGYVVYWAELELDVSGRCIAQVTRSSFTCLLAALIASALESVRASSKRRGRIGIHASEQDGCVLVEVHHNGRFTRTDLGLGVLDVHGPNRANHADLLAIRRRAQQLGGDLLVDSDEEGTTLRLLLAAGDHDELGICLQDGWDYRRSRKQHAG
jgi:hypothetical protein